MNTFFSVTVILLGNIFISYLISFYSFTVAIAWFCFAIGFQLGKWYGSDRKEQEFIAREEVIREEYEQN